MPVEAAHRVGGVGDGLVALGLSGVSGKVRPYLHPGRSRGRYRDRSVGWSVVAGTPGTEAGRYRRFKAEPLGAASCWKVHCLGPLSGRQRRNLAPWRKRPLVMWS